MGGLGVGVGVGAGVAVGSGVGVAVGAGVGDAVGVTRTAATDAGSAGPVRLRPTMMSANAALTKTTAETVRSAETRLVRIPRGYSNCAVRNARLSNGADVGTERLFGETSVLPNNGEECARRPTT